MSGDVIGLASANTVDAIRTATTPATPVAGDIGKAMIVAAVGLLAWSTDFGANLIESTVGIALESAPAASGTVRLSQGSSITYRSNDGTTDIFAMRVVNGPTDDLIVGQGMFLTTLTLDAASRIAFSIGGVERGHVEVDHFTINPTASANVPSVGTLRFANGFSIYSATAAGVSRQILLHNVTDALTLGNTATTLFLNSAAGMAFQIAAVQVAQFRAAGLSIGAGVGTYGTGATNALQIQTGVAASTNTSSGQVLQATATTLSIRGQTSAILHLVNPVLTTTATAGAGGVVPANVEEYMTIQLGANTRKIPCFLP